MVNFGASLYNALPQSFLGGNRLASSNYSLQETDESTRGGNSLRLATSQFRQDAGLADFSPPPKGQQGFASLGPVLEKFQPDIPPLYELSGPTSWERLLEEQKRISAAREQAARDFEDLLSSRDRAQTELEDRLQLIKENAERVRFEAQPVEDNNTPALATEPDDNVSNSAQQALNILRTADDEADINFNEEQLPSTSEAAPLPGQGTRIEDADQPANEIFNDQSMVSEKRTPLPGSGTFSEQQQVARLFSTEDNTGNAINFFA